MNPTLYSGVLLKEGNPKFLKKIFNLFKQNSIKASGYCLKNKTYLPYKEHYESIKKEAEKLIKTKAFKENFSLLKAEYIAKNKTFEISDFRLRKNSKHKKISKRLRYDFSGDFQNFIYVIDHVITGYTPSFIDLKTEHQASPPKEVYEMVGHVADINVKKMNYSYLYD